MARNIAWRICLWRKVQRLIRSVLNQEQLAAMVGGLRIL
jgi:hypothetical protein